MSTSGGSEAFMDFLLTVDKRRTFKALMIEQLTAGGLMDPRISQALDRMRRATGDTLRLKAEIRALEQPPVLHTNKHTFTVTEEHATALPGQVPQEPNFLKSMMEKIAGGRRPVAELDIPESLEAEAVEVPPRKSKKKED